MSKAESRMEQARHELYTDLEDHVKRELIDLGIEQAASEQAATSVINFLMAHWGGQYITFPKDYKFVMSKRDLEIYDSHRGNFLETAKRWGMTDRGVRKVIERVSKRIVERNQGRLF